MGRLEATVNLKIADLDNKLDTPYFHKHPEEKQAILDQLKNLGERTQPSAAPI